MSSSLFTWGRRTLPGALPLLLTIASAAVVDRIAVVVGNTVITESEVLDELRLSELESGRPLDVSGAKRREAAERMVDQQLIRKEVEASAFTPPPASEADALLRKFRQEHFASAAAYRTALQKYGVNEEQLKKHLLWELTAIQFTDQRFRPIAAAAAPQSANRLRAGASAPAANTVDQQMNAWLKDARSSTRIVFKKEAFQ